MADPKESKIWNYKNLMVVLTLASVAIAFGSWQFPKILEQNQNDDTAEKAPVVEPIALDGGISGTWNFEYTIWQTINHDGDVQSTTEQKIRILRLQEQDGRVTGKVIGSHNDEICTDIALSGTFDGNRLSLSLDYTGSCCAGAETIFEGEVSSTAEVVGKHSPSDAPPTSCRLWWADVTATKL